MIPIKKKKALLMGVGDFNVYVYKDYVIIMLYFKIYTLTISP